MFDNVYQLEQTNVFLLFLSVAMDALDPVLAIQSFHLLNAEYELADYNTVSRIRGW
jgi:hypothetical protein